MLKSKILLAPLVVVSVLLSLSLVLAAAPVANDDTYAINEDSVLTISVAQGVLANDTDADAGDTLTAIRVTNVLHGTLTLNADGSFTYAPTANYNGADSFTYKANDSTGTQSVNPATVRFTVNSINDLPTLTAPAQLVAIVGSPFSYAINATDIEDGTSLTYTYDAKGWTTFSANSGTISFTPQEEDVGLHPLTITVTDSANANVTKNTNILVTEACDDGTLDVTDGSVTIDDITGDDSELEPGDYLDLEFDVVNKISKDFSDVKARVWIENSDGVRLGQKVDTTKEDLEAKDSRTETINNFRVEPTAKAGTYTLFVRAEGDDEDSNTKCSLYAKQIKVVRNSHTLLVDNVKFSPTEPVCGGKVQVTATIYNTGATTEDDVRLKVENVALNLETLTAPFELKTTGSSSHVEKSLIFNLPTTAKGTYNMDVSAVFDGSSETVVNSVDIPVTCGTVQVAAAQAGASAISAAQTTTTAQSGQTVKFTLTVTNTEATQQTYSISLSGVSDWAASSVEPQSVVLAPGAETPIYVYVTPKAGTYGSQSATATVKSRDTVLATKTLTVQLPEKAATTVTDLGHISRPSGLNNESIVALIVIAIVIVATLALNARRARRAAVEVYTEKTRK